MGRPSWWRLVRKARSRRQILLHPRAYVMPEEQVLVPFSRRKFDAVTGDLTDVGTRERLRCFLEALGDWGKRFERPAAAHYWERASEGLD